MLVAISEWHIQYVGYGWSYLLGVNGFATFYLAQMLNIFAKSYEPCLIATGNMLSMLCP